MRGVVWNPPSGHSMARMHARRKGRSGSRRPLGAKNPDWVPLEPDEVEETIMRLAAQGESSGGIGLVPRGQYAVPHAPGSLASVPLEAESTGHLEPAGPAAPRVPDPAARPVLPGPGRPSRKLGLLRQDSRAGDEVEGRWPRLPASRM